MVLPLPSFDVTAGLLPFVAIALPMVVITVTVLGLVRPSDGRPPLVTQLLLAVAIVGGSSVLLVALLFVFLDPNGTTAWTWVLVAFNFMMMVPLGLWFIGQIIYRDRRVVEGSWRWPAALGAAVTGSEVLMGLLFALGGSSGTVSAVGAFALGLSSVWFFWSMAGVMAPLVLWAPLSSVGRAGGWALVAAAVVAPWVRSYPLDGGLAMAALMGLALAALLRPLVRGAVAGSDGGLLLGLAGAFVAMSASGLAVAASGGSDAAVVVFGGAMAVVMVAEVSYLLRRTYAPGIFVPRPGIAPASVAPTEGSAAHAGPAAGP
jgi:hypothetical protein